ncbi:MAG: phage holin family protein [Phycisphaerae bacterium]
MESARDKQMTAQEKEQYIAQQEDQARSAPTLLHDLTQEAVTLLRQEAALAKKEMAEKAQTFARNSAAIAIGGAVAWAGVLVLLAATAVGLYIALINVMPWFHAAWLSPLIIGGVVAIVGIVMVEKGKKTIENQTVVPQKTAETMKENKEWIKNEIK